MYHEIKTERLLLRPLGLDDLNTAHEYAGDEENTRYMMRLPNATIAETAEFLTRVSEEWARALPMFYEFAIVTEGVHIGAISVYLDDKRETGELGWILNKKYQGRGFATEAALAVKDFARDVLRVKKLVAQCDGENAPSYRLMRRIGLKLESADGTRFYAKRNETASELTYSCTFSEN